MENVAEEYKKIWDMGAVIAEDDSKKYPTGADETEIRKRHLFHTNCMMAMLTEVFSSTRGEEAQEW